MESREKAWSHFTEYAGRYDRDDGRINLKIVHTREVAKVMDELVGLLGLDGKIRELAYICAVYHDIGRFEQLRRFGTFEDGKSIDHAKTGCEVLEQAGFLAYLPEAEQRMVFTAIRNHNRLAVEKGLDEDTLLLCRLIRDADKCDIFRVFACEDMVDTMGETVEQVADETVTDEVLESVLAHRCVDKRIRRTGLDKWVGFLSFFYDLYFTESFRILEREKYYLRPFAAAKFTKPDTRRRVQMILDDLEEYIRARTRDHTAV